MGGVTAFRAIASTAALLVMWRTGLLQTLLLLPFTIIRGILSPYWSRAELQDTSSVAGAVLNVTTDHKQMAELFDDFLHSPGIDPQMEEHFRAFLARQRIRSFPRLETALDWLLQLYWIILPIVVFSMLCNMTNKKATDDTPPPSPVGQALLSHGPRRAGSAGSSRGAGGVATTSLGSVQQSSHQPLPPPRRSSSSGALPRAPSEAAPLHEAGSPLRSGSLRKRLS
mmetsp:Transcript_13811/g.41737  ORF Transcript_13811/g.41737 Transcript_13811/m.41737 type:complete len:226 (+) Transcript_13811:230-907(+)